MCLEMITSEFRNDEAIPKKSMVMNGSIKSISPYVTDILSLQISLFGARFAFAEDMKASI